MTKIQMALRLGAAAVMAGMAAACLPLPGGRSLTSRTVASKGLTDLIADDGASCAVSEETMNEVRIGEPHTCVWTAAERGVAQKRRPVTGSTPKLPPGTIRRGN